MRGRLRKAAGRLSPGAPGVPSVAMPPPRGQEAPEPLRADEPPERLRSPYERPVVVDHGPLADLTWARFSGLEASLCRCDGP